MAAPNIVGVTSIYGKTAVDADIAASPASLLTCPADKVIKLNSLIIANIDGTNAANITVDIFRSSVAYHLAKTISVPSDATLVVISKDISVYLEEGDVLRVTASASGDLSAVCSYEELDDA
jgi:hypothetical protein